MIIWLNALQQMTLDNKLMISVLSCVYFIIVLIIIIIIVVVLIIIVAVIIVIIILEQMSLDNQLMISVLSYASLLALSGVAVSQPTEFRCFVIWNLEFPLPDKIF